MILKFQDIDGDNDALDPGECKVFAAGFSLPSGLAAQPPQLPPLAIDLGVGMGTGIEDLGKGSDLLLPDGATRMFTIQVVDKTTETPFPNMKVVCDVVAGCLLCDPKTGQTDGSGKITFTVSRAPGTQPTGDEGLVVSTLGDAKLIHVLAEALEELFTLTVTKAGTGSGTVTGPGINCGSDCEERYPINTEVTLMATPAANSKFDGFSGDPDCTDAKVTMDASKTCIATFTKKGKSGGSQSSHLVDTATRVVLSHIKTLAGQGQPFKEIVQTRFSLQTFERLPFGTGLLEPTAIPGGWETLQALESAAAQLQLF